MALGVAVQFTNRLGDDLHRRVHLHAPSHCTFSSPSIGTLHSVTDRAANWNPEVALSGWLVDYRREFTRLHGQSVVRRTTALLERGGHTLSVSEVARAVGCSVAVLQRRFVSDTGMTVGRYRTRVRIAAAIARLRTSDDKVETIAFELGWKSKKGLYRAFRVLAGTTPAAIRAKRGCSTAADNAA